MSHTYTDHEIQDLVITDRDDTWKDFAKLWGVTIFLAIVIVATATWVGTALHWI